MPGVNTAIVVYPDGSQWCAAEEGFPHDPRAAAGFGETPADALIRMAAEVRDREKYPVWNRKLVPVPLASGEEVYVPSSANRLSQEEQVRLHERPTRKSEGPGLGHWGVRDE